jgi:hypothetical protein
MDKENVLICTVCYEIFDTKRQQPTILMMCGHTFCLKCVKTIKQSSKCSCPTCREEIINVTPNYALIATLQSTGSSPVSTQKFFDQIEFIKHPKHESNTFSMKHIHYLTMLDKCKTNWVCDGSKHIERCQSGRKETSSDTPQYECVVCNCFGLCHECTIHVKSKKSKSVESFEYKEYKSKNHLHEFQRLPINLDNSDWKCNGYQIFGECKSVKNNNSSYQSRFKCTTCDDFNLCLKCITEPMFTHAHEVACELQHELHYSKSSSIGIIITKVITLFLACFLYLCMDGWFDLKNHSIIK